jgi:hypothetical protein
MEDVEEGAEGAGELRLVSGLVEGLDEVPASDDGALVVLGAGVTKVTLGIEVIVDPGPMDGTSLGLGADIKEGDRVNWDWEGKNDDSIVDGVAETLSTGLGALLIDGAKVIVPPPIDGASVMLGRGIEVGIEVPVPDDGVKLLLGAVVVASLEGDEVVGSAPVVDGASLVIKAVGADDGAVRILGAFDVNSVELGLEVDPDVGKRDSDDKLDGRKEGVWELVSLGEVELVVVGVEVVPDPVDGASLGAVLVEVKLILGDDVVTSLGIGEELKDGDKVDPAGRNFEGKLEGNVVGIRERVSFVLGEELSLVDEVVGADDDSTILGEELAEEGNIDLDDGRRDWEGKVEGGFVGEGERVSVLLGVGTTVVVSDPRDGASLGFGAIVVEVGPDEDGTELWLGARVLTSVPLGKVDGRSNGKGDGPCEGCPLLGEEVPEGGDVDPMEGTVEGSCDGGVDGIRLSCVGGSDGLSEDVIRIDGNSDGILVCSVGNSDGPSDGFSLVACADGPCEGLSLVGCTDGPFVGSALGGSVEVTTEGGNVDPLDGGCDGFVDCIRCCVGSSDGSNDDGNSDGILVCSVGNSDGPGDGFSLVACADGPCEGLSPVGWTDGLVIGSALGGSVEVTTEGANVDPLDGGCDGFVDSILCRVGSSDGSNDGASLVFCEVVVNDGDDVAIVDDGTSDGSFSSGVGRSDGPREGVSLVFWNGVAEGGGVVGSIDGSIEGDSDGLVEGISSSRLGSSDGPTDGASV